MRESEVRCYILRRIVRRLPSIILRGAAVAALAALAACELLPTAKPVATPAPQPQPAPEMVVAPPPVTVEAPPKPAAPQPPLRAVTWDDIPHWREDNPALALSAFIAGCSALKSQTAWQAVCEAAAAMTDTSRDAVTRFFETGFAPYQVVNADGGDSGLVTGYYEPLLHGSRRKSARFPVPVYGVPDDLLVVDLGELYPELKNMRLRGRVDGRRVVPYYNREQIDGGAAPVAGKEIVWVEDSIELFFMQIQGSGCVRLDTHETIAIGYAEQNGHP
mgnify:CR=1 FL=1